MRFLVAPIVAALLAGSAAGQAAKTKEDEAPRLPPRLLELLKGWSAGYELDGRRVGPTQETGAMVNIAGAPRPVLKDMGRRACYTAYVQDLARGIKPPLELERVAKTYPKNAAVDELAKVLEQHGFPDLKGRGGSLDELFGGGDEAATGASGVNSALLAAVRVVARRERIAFHQRLRGFLTTLPKPSGEPLSITTKIETAEGKVSLAFTNASTKPLHDVAATVRLVSDPALVAKKADADFGSRAGAENSDRDAARKTAALEIELLGLDKFTTAYIPEVTPGATVKLPLAKETLFALVKSAELSLWAVELAETTYPVQGRTASTGRTLALDSRGHAAAEVVVGESDPRDPSAEPGKPDNRMAVLTAELAARVAYEVRIAWPPGVDPAAGRLPRLRIEDAAGKVVAQSREARPGWQFQALDVTPESSGEYHIVVAGAAPASRFALTVAPLPPGSKKARKAAAKPGP